MRQSLLVLCCLALLLTSLPAQAARSKDRSGTIEIHHYDNQLINKNFRGQVEVLSLAAKRDFFLDDREDITVIVTDPNLLLFTYSWKGIEKTPSATFENASKFAKVLSILMTNLDNAKENEKNKTMIVQTVVDVADQDSAGYLSLDAGQARKTCATLLSEGIVVTPDEITDLLNTIQDPDPRAANELLVEQRLNAEFFENLKKLVESLSKKQARMDELIALSGTREGLTAVKEAVDQWDLGNLTKKIKEAYQILDDARSTFMSALTPIFEAHPILERKALLLLLHDSKKAEVEEILSTLKIFADLVERSGEPKELGTISYDAENDQTATFTITPQQKQAQNIDDSNLKHGSFTLDFEAYSPVIYGFGIGEVYSFVDRPAFSTEETADGLKIIQTEGDEPIGQKITGWLTLTPRAWSFPTFSGEFHIGVNPESDEVGLYLGGGIRYREVFSFGLGFTYQEVPKLDGQAVGDILPTADDLKTDTEFEGGFYLMVTASKRFGSKKKS